jgi:hypothetical protein
MKLNEPSRSTLLGVKPRPCLGQLSGSVTRPHLAVPAEKEEERVKIELGASFKNIIKKDGVENEKSMILDNLKFS